MAERQYGVATNISFPLIVFASTNADFSTASVLVDGDVAISKDGSTWVALSDTGFAQIGNLNSGIFRLAIGATEMQAAEIVLKIIDQDGPAFEDQAIIIETYGSTSAMHKLNRGSTSVSVSAIGIGVITSTSIGAGAILSTGIATGALTEAKFAANAISTANINPTVYTQLWAESTRSVTAILSGAITSTSFGAGAINSTSIATGALLAEKFATDALTTDAIAAGVFTAINAEVLDVLSVDTFGETGVSTSPPTPTQSITGKIGELHSALINKIEVSTANKTFFTSTGGQAFTKVLTDDGTYNEAQASS